MKIQGFKKRTFQLNDRVRVYRNLNNGKWSIQSMSGEFKGKVVGHVAHLKLTNVEFKVSMAGRARILKEKRKNVCAFAVGYLTSINASHEQCNESNEITFNPYESDFFCYTKNKQVAVTRLDSLLFNGGKAFVSEEDAESL